MTVEQFANVWFLWVLPAIVVIYGFVVWRWTIAWNRYWKSKWALEDRQRLTAEKHKGK